MKSILTICSLIGAVAFGASGQTTSDNSQGARSGGANQGSLPPGLQNRQQLPPGLQNRDTLPPGLQQRQQESTISGTSNQVSASGSLYEQGSAYGLGGSATNSQRSSRNVFGSTTSNRFDSGSQFGSLSNETC